MNLQNKIKYRLAIKLLKRAQKLLDDAYKDHLKQTIGP